MRKQMTTGCPAVAQSERAMAILNANVKEGFRRMCALVLEDAITVQQQRRALRMLNASVSAGLLELQRGPCKRN